MKKTIFGLLAILAFVVPSCEKEATVTPPAVGPNSIPETLTGVISDDEITSTTYDSDGKFTWNSSDQVRLLVCEDLSTYSSLGYYTYRVKSLSEDSKTAVFTSTGSAGELMNFVDGTWKSTNIAMYPASAVNRFGKPESHSYGTPWFTLARGNVSGSESDIILTGTKGTNNYKFSTAMGVLKVTLTDIPANAAAVKLITDDKSSYPIDGDFALSINGDMVDMSFLSTWVSDFNGYQKVDISSEGAIAERSFYFNVPAASYPANNLFIAVEDANGGQIIKRKIAQAVTVARNERHDFPALSLANSVAFSGGSVTAPRIAWSINCKRVRFCVSQSPDIDPSTFVKGYMFTNNNATGKYSDGYTVTSFGPQKPTTSGKYYLHYILQSDDANSVPASLSAANVVGYGTIPFYFITSADQSAFVGTYTFTYSDGGIGKTENPDDGILCHPGTSSNYLANMILAASNNYLKGNIMMTTLYGKDQASGKQLYGCLDVPNNSLTFPYAGDGSDGYFHDAGNKFHVASATSVTYSSGDKLSSTANGDLEFSIDASNNLTHADYLVMKYTSASGYPVDGVTYKWGAFIYGKGLTFVNPN